MFLAFLFYDKSLRVDSAIINETCCLRRFFFNLSNQCFWHFCFMERLQEDPEKIAEHTDRGLFDQISFSYFHVAGCLWEDSETKGKHMAYGLFDEVCFWYSHTVASLLHHTHNLTAHSPFQPLDKLKMPFKRKPALALPMPIPLVLFSKRQLCYHLTFTPVLGCLWMPCPSTGEQMFR